MRNVQARYLVRSRALDFTRRWGKWWTLSAHLFVEDAWQAYRAARSKDLSPAREYGVYKRGARVVMPEAVTQWLEDLLAVARQGAGGGAGGAIRASHEVDAAGPDLVPDDHGHGVLLQLPRQGGRGAPGTPGEGSAVVLGSNRLQEVHDDARLAAALPDAAGPDQGRVPEVPADDIFGPLGEVVRREDPCVEGACAASDVESGAADRSEGAEIDGPQPQAGHDRIVSLLEARGKRRGDRRWIYIEEGYPEEHQRGGVLVETSWLDDDQAAELGPGWTRLQNGSYQRVIPSKDYRENLARALRDVAAAFTSRRGK
jgi:hypothetical protein